MGVGLCLHSDGCLHGTHARRRHPACPRPSPGGPRAGGLALALADAGGGGGAAGAAVAYGPHGGSLLPALGALTRRNGQTAIIIAAAVYRRFHPEHPLVQVDVAAAAAAAAACRRLRPQHRPRRVEVVLDTSFSSCRWAQPPRGCPAVDVTAIIIGVARAAAAAATAALGIVRHSQHRADAGIRAAFSVAAVAASHRGVTHRLQPTIAWPPRRLSAQHTDNTCHEDEAGGQPALPSAEIKAPRRNRGKRTGAPPALPPRARLSHLRPVSCAQPPQLRQPPRCEPRTGHQPARTRQPSAAPTAATLPHARPGPGPSPRSEQHPTCDL
jgi:hypothetical protein